MTERRPVPATSDAFCPRCTKVALRLANQANKAEAALAERDREWAKALDESHYDYIDGLHYEKCAECAPLASLLAAGKGRTE